MIWVEDDGGRSAAGFRGHAGDCVVRAIAIATGLPYETVYSELSLMNHLRGEGSARNGTYRREYEAYLKRLGWQWTPTMRIGSGCTTHLRADELPAGPVICRLTRHLTAVLDGVIHDTFDPSRDGTRCVYGYFTPGPSAAASFIPPSEDAATNRPHEATDENEREEVMPMSDTQTVEAPVAEDVTGQEPETQPSPKDLHKAILKRLKERKGDAKATLTEKSAYYRVQIGGRTVLYLHKPTKKSIRLEFPTGNGAYEAAKVTTPEDVDALFARLDQPATTEES